MKRQKHNMASILYLLMAMKIPSWIPPPVGHLKLNFDESFPKEVRKGGYGGVIRHSLGTSLCTYSGSLECAHSNEAEVFVKLVGCHELWKLRTSSCNYRGRFPFSHSMGIG